MKSKHLLQILHKMIKQTIGNSSTEKTLPLVFPLCYKDSPCNISTYDVDLHILEIAVN